VGGARAPARLAATIQTHPLTQVRAAAMSALEGSGDPRALDLALPALASADADVVLAAIAVLRGQVARETGTRIFDALTAAALDRDRDAAVRLAALDALSTLPPEQVQAIVAEARTEPAPSAHTDDPSTAREWLAANAASAPLSDLHALVTALSAHERSEASARRRQEWQAVRGAAHAVLAQRGSKVALYDLRETFDAAHEPLPLDFLTAAHAIGDASCLEPMARAWAAAPRETWWRERLSEAAEAIVDRTRLSGRSAVIKRLRARYDGFV